MDLTTQPKRGSREAGLREVFDVLRTQAPIARIQLAGRVSVSRATLSGIVGDLIESGFLEETGDQPSTGGRPARLLAYRPQARLAVGVVQFDDQLRATLTDFEGSPLRTLEMSFHPNSPQDMLRAMIGLVEQVLEGQPRRQVVAVGAGVPGVVDFASGTLEASVGMGWLEGKIAVKAELEGALGLPVYAVNRSRVAALGEQRVGVGRGCKNLVYVFLGKGIAAGILLDGRLYFGARSGAGEIGHVPVAPDGPLCRCGSRGCLEVFAAEDALLAAARAQVKADQDNPLYPHLDRLQIAGLIQAARQGNSAARQTFADAGAKIGYAVSILINLFDPQMVILGGPIGAAAGEILLQPVIREAQRCTIPRSFANTRIVASQLGSEAATQGAALLAILQTPVEALLK